MVQMLMEEERDVGEVRTAGMFLTPLLCIGGEAWRQSGMDKRRV